MIKGADSSRGCDVSQEKADGSSIVTMRLRMRCNAMQCASVGLYLWVVLFCLFKAASRAGIGDNTRKARRETGAAVATDGYGGCGQDAPGARRLRGADKARRTWVDQSQGGASKLRKLIR